MNYNLCEASIRFVQRILPVTLGLRLENWFKLWVLPYIRDIQNRKGRRIYEEHVHGYAPTDLEKRYARDLLTDGIAFGHYSDFFSDETFQALVEFYERETEGKEPAVGSRLTLPEAGVPIGDDLLSKEVFLNPSFINICSLYHGTTPLYRGSVFWKSFPGKTDQPAGPERWHRDYHDLKNTKVFIYVDDVDEESGAFEYVKGSHFHGPNYYKIPWTTYRTGRISEEEIHGHPELAADRVVAAGKKGTVALGDAEGFHKGGFCTKKVRKVVEISFFCKSAFVGKDYGPAINLKRDELDQAYNDRRMRYVLQLP